MNNGIKSKTIGILYICTGKYNVFWKDFYESCEKYLLTKEGYKKEYFVFTDALNIAYEENNLVHPVYQEALSWPYITLFRFKIFNNSKELYTNCDYLYFFNANMLCVDDITEEFLPSLNKKLSFLQHPGFFDKDKKDFTYERNIDSLAGVKRDEGQYYFQGALNGGNKEAYLKMSKILEENINKDLQKNLIALWHDESHLNRYAIDNANKIRILNPSYGEGWDLPFDAKILIRDKNNFGGHNFLRNKKSWFIKILDKLKK